MTPARTVSFALSGRKRNQTLGSKPRKPLFASRSLNAKVNGEGVVEVDVFLSTSAEIAKLGETIATLAAARSGSRAKVKPLPLDDILRKAATDLLEHRLADELSGVVAAYRAFLRESLVTGENGAVKAALNRARLQEKILAATPTVDQAQACQLLGLSAANPSATMKRKEDRGEILRFSIDGRAAYPLLQFDVEGRRVFPAIARLEAAKPKGWSDFRLLHWLVRPHLDFEGAPAEALGRDEEGVMAAFAREIEPPVHG